MPAPPKNASPTNTIRTSSGSIPNWAPRPLQTPPISLPARVRTKRGALSGMGEPRAADRRSAGGAQRPTRAPARRSSIGRRSGARAALAHDGAVNEDRERDVSEHSLADGLERDRAAAKRAFAGGGGDGVGDEHMARPGERGDARGDVHGGAEEVAGALDGGAVVDADADGRVGLRGKRAGCDPRPRADRLGGVGDAHHHGVAERLDDVRIRAELLLDAEAKAPRKRGGSGVAVRLGVGSERDDVDEQERRREEVYGSRR